VPETPAIAVEPTVVAGQLRLSITRLARILRQQDPGSLGPTLSSALATVHHAGPVGSITLGELAEREHVTPPTITRVVEKLEARGLVARCVDPQDRRVVRLQVTPAGEEHLEATRTRRTAWLAARLQELSDQDLAALAAGAEVLDRLVAGISREVARP
jgi:DNA-binding MarR family transcriptional regulator